MGIDPGLLVLRLCEPTDHRVVASQNFPQDSFHAAGKTAAAVVGLDVRHIYMPCMQHFGCCRFCDLHGLFCIEHIQHVSLVGKCHAVIDTAKVILASVRGICVIADLFKLRQLPAVGFKAGIEPAFKVDGLLLVVGRSNIRPHGFDLGLVGLIG